VGHKTSTVIKLPSPLRSATRRSLIAVTFLVLSTATLGFAPTDRQPGSLPEVTRDEMIATAKRISGHEWVCKRQNLVAPCVKKYDSDWKEDQRVKGVPYDWGGGDTPEVFDSKLKQGQAAGSHSRHGVTGCTAGIDCSGFVTTCWGFRGHPYSTSNLRKIAGRSKANWFTDMKPGDAFNKPGSHVVLFAGYHENGTPYIYEASGALGRVVYRNVSWSYLKGYWAAQYLGLRED
jgi:hypothetical protein